MRASKIIRFVLLTLCISSLGTTHIVLAQVVLCPDGSYASKGPCHLCPNGKYVGGSDQCVLAPDGSYVPGGGHIILCPDGKYATGTQCVLTPDGHYVGKD